MGQQIENTVRCECGEATGVRCEWCGPVGDTVVIEWMPKFLRASHTAAGGNGSYPANGSERLRVECSCADLLLETDGEWTRLV